MSDEQKPTRLPFDVEFYNAVNDFSTNIMASIPELQAVAIIPVWNPQPENIPTGALRLRNPEPPYIPELFKLISRLASYSVEIHRELAGQIGIFDQHAQKLAEEIKKRHETLDALIAKDAPPNVGG